MISSAFKDQVTIFANPPIWLPSPINMDNFQQAWNQVPFGLFMLNSMKVAGIVTAGQLITCTTAAYAFARLRFPCG